MTNREAIELLKAITLPYNDHDHGVAIEEARRMALFALESPRDWTPCAEGLPTNSARYKVTLQVGSEAGTWLETAIIPYRYCDGTGEWILPKSDWMIYGVIAWTKADEPYRADDTTGKVKEDEFMREAMYDQLHSNGN